SAASSSTPIRTPRPSTGGSSPTATGTSSSTSAATWRQARPSSSGGPGAASTPRPGRPTSTRSSPCASAKACPIPGCCGRGPRDAAGLLHAAIPAGRRRVVLLVAPPALGAEARAVHLLHEDAGLEGRRGRAALADALGTVAV